MTTPRDFAVALLSALELPVTTNNVAALVSAQAAEGGFMANAAEQSAFYNPLNITQVLNSTTATGYANGAVKIQAYPDWATGLRAAVALFRNGKYNDILASLADDAAPATTLAVWAKNPSYGWTQGANVNTAYGSMLFPQGPSNVPLEAATGIVPSSTLVAMVMESGIAFGVGYGLFYAWKLLGRR